MQTHPVPDPAPLLFDPILRLTRNIRAAFEARVRQTRGLTFARARLLAAISHNPGASQAELAAALEIETPTLKRQLDALQAQGLAERRPMAEDARKHAIYLTEAAGLEQILGFRAEVEAALTEGIAPDDLITTRRVLTRMAENAERLKRI